MGTAFTGKRSSLGANQVENECRTHAINTQTWIPEVQGAMGRWDATIGPLILALTKPTEWAQHSCANGAASVPTRLGLNVTDMQATHNAMQLKDYHYALQGLVVGTTFAHRKLSGTEPGVASQPRRPRMPWC